jgi:hypothetical protein
MVELVQQLEPACQQAGHVFVASVSRLLERLLGKLLNRTAAGKYTYNRSPTRSRIYLQGKNKLIIRQPSTGGKGWFPPAASHPCWLGAECNRQPACISHALRAPQAPSRYGAQPKSRLAFRDISRAANRVRINGRSRRLHPCSSLFIALPWTYFSRIY